MTDACCRDVQARVDAGLLPPNDVLSAQAQRARQQRAADPGAERRRAWPRRTSRGWSARRPATPSTADDAGDQPTPAAAALDGSRRRRCVERARARAARARTRSIARAGVARRRPRRRPAPPTRPQVAAVAGGRAGAAEPAFVPRVDRRGTRRGTLGVNVTWPLFDGGRGARRPRGRRRAGRAPSDARLQRVRRAARRRGPAAPARRASPAARPSRRRPRPCAAATEARRVVGERFAAGVATSTDVLDAQVGAAPGRTRAHARWPPRCAWARRAWLRAVGADSR